VGPAGGYLIASSQGDDSFAVYSRLQDNRYIGSFSVMNNPDNGVDSVQDCDGGQVSKQWGRLVDNRENFLDNREG
jgi:myo-inositol-hexaphosphate 3-phosphohydrolase